MRRNADASVRADRLHGVKSFFINFRHKPAMADHPSLRGLTQGFAVVALAAFGLFAALMGGPVSGQVAAVFPPWWDAMRSVNAAAEGGSVLRLGPLNFVVLVVPEVLHGRERLWRAGVWLLLYPRSLPGCSSETGVKSNGGSSATRR
jgi:hypothetical protein